jgi:hypothetical protein
MELGSVLVVQIGIKLLVSLIFGFAALKIYDLFVKAFAQKNRLTMWCAFVSAIFLFFMMLLL